MHRNKANLGKMAKDGHKWAKFVVESEMYFPSQLTTNQVEKEKAVKGKFGGEKVSSGNSRKYQKMFLSKGEKEEKKGKMGANEANGKTMKKSFSVQLNKSFQYKNNFSEKKIQEWIEQTETEPKENATGESVLNSFRVNIDKSDDHIFQNNFRRNVGQKQPSKAHETLAPNHQIIGLESQFRGSFGKKKAEEMSSIPAKNKESKFAPKFVNQGVYNSFNESLEGEILEIKAGPNEPKMAQNKFFMGQTEKKHFAYVRPEMEKRVPVKSMEFPKISLLKQFMKNVDFEAKPERKLGIFDQKLEGPISFKIPNQTRPKEPEMLKKSMSQPLKMTIGESKYRASETTREPSLSRVAKRLNQSSSKKPRFTFKQRQININELKQLFEKEIEKLNQSKQESSELVLESPTPNLPKKPKLINRTSLEQISLERASQEKTPNKRASIERATQAQKSEERESEELVSLDEDSRLFK